MTQRPIQAVIVAFEGAADLRRCLEAMAGCLPITVVDNSSSQTVRAVVNDHKALYIDAGQNLGFASGVNIALRTIMAGPACDVLLLNPDATITAGAVLELHRHLHLSGTRGAVSPRLSDLHGHAQRVMWPFPSPARAVAEALGLGHLPARGRFAVGAVLLLRWEALQDVGLFDERFFLYAEEADWQRRAWARGWRAEVCETASAVHVGAGTSANPVHRERLFFAGQETYIRKWAGSVGWRIYQLANVFGAVLRSLLLSGERAEAARRRASIFWHGPRTVAGVN